MQIKRREPAQDLSGLPNVPPLLQRIYGARGVSVESQLDKSLKALLPFHTLTDIDKACIRLEQALEKQERILVIGDFDADGATSTAVAVSVLRALKAEVDFLVPNRFEFGYGLTPGIVGLAAARNPHLIITVDNGISSIEGVDAANEAGIDVLITDHHLSGDSLPKAYAIVNPNQPKDAFPSKSIAGVGVIFYLMLALRRHLCAQGYFAKKNIPEPNMSAWLDLVALGTVADVVSLDHNNRILVSQGLARMRQGLCRFGIRALASVSARNLATLTTSDLGFALAPRLNAAGRLDDMSLGIACLLADNQQEAEHLAEQLDSLNKERRIIEAEMKDQALILVHQMTKKMESSRLPKALCLMDPGWHQGVIGILAGRLKEKFHRPVIAFAAVSEDEIKGSARSVAGLNIRDALALVDKNYPGLIKKFGGHAMAAGLSLHPAAFSDFQVAFNQEVDKILDSTDLEGYILTDGMLTEDALTLETAALLKAAGPWGQQFPEPCFDGIFELIDQRLVGQNHLKLTLLMDGGTVLFDGIAFNIDRNLWPNFRVKKAHIAYKVEENYYQNRARLQLLVEVINPILTMD